ncbi:MAG: class I SAM-dependent methyltransferase [Chloroflexia bacterium]|nr:class I SAM-dependent methyltransferase [Chloroflexia bacterium]
MVKRSQPGPLSSFVSPATLAHLPLPAERRIALHVTPAAERALRRGHPWLFEGSIRRQSHQGRPGDIAVVFDRQRRFLALGLYDPNAPIRVRILQHHRPAPIDGEWFRARLAAAAARRAPLLDPDCPPTTAYRLVHGANDGLPALVVDLYEGTGVLKLYSSAWLPHLREVCRALAAVCTPQRLVLRLGRGMQEQHQDLYGLNDGLLLAGPALEGPVLFWENGLRFEADPLRGQKTGFFLDQRDNRARVEDLAAGREVLNLFAYTGAFSVYAARGGARGVVSVDLGEPALQVARRNLAHNRQVPAVAAVKHQFIADDVFAVLADLSRQGRRFDLVIVDPPSFAHSQSQRQGALAAYRRLTQQSLDVLRPGGVLVQASCSSQVEAGAFFQAVHQAATAAGRPLREIERTGHPLDHPIAFPEAAYLKCLFAVVP